jgi:hypothetical protein
LAQVQGGLGGRGLVGVGEEAEVLVPVPAVLGVRSLAPSPGILVVQVSAQALVVLVLFPARAASADRGCVPHNQGKSCRSSSRRC